MSATLPSLAVFHLSSASSSLLVPLEGHEEIKAEAREGKIVSLSGALPDFTSEFETYARLEIILNPNPVDIEFPEDDCCPVTGRLMRDPVSTADGQIYEREAIEAWLEAHDTSPLGGYVQLKNKELTSIIYVKNSIKRFIEKNPAVKDSKEWYLPKAWINELAQACKIGDVESIKKLADRDPRLLVHTFSEGAYQGKTAIELAAVGSLKALEAVIELLEKRQLGLGLATLLQANKKRALPFYLALEEQAPVTLLKLMAWMGKQTIEIDRECFERSVQDAKDIGGNHLLHLAATTGAAQVIDLLFEHKAELERVNERGETALHVAAANNQVDVLGMFLARQAKLSALDKEWNTALHAAVQAGASEAAVFLLKAGISAELQNARGQTARQLAEANKEAVIIERIDETLNTLKLREEDIHKSQEGAGVSLPTQQQLVTQLRSKLEGFEALSKAQSCKLIEQACEIEDLKKQLATMAERYGLLIERPNEQIVKTKADSQQPAHLNAEAEPLLIAAEQKYQPVEAEQPQAKEAEKEVALRKEGEPQSSELEEGGLSEAQQAAAYTLERQRKETEERERLLLLQDELVTACEQGELEKVRELLGRGAKASTEGTKRRKPLGAAVWGMNPEVVDLLTSEMKGVSSLSWDECEAHNSKHYSGVFMFSRFAPSRYCAWSNLLAKMARSPLLREQHLAETQRLWDKGYDISWGSLVSWVTERRWPKNFERDRLPDDVIEVCECTHNYHRRLIVRIVERVRASAAVTSLSSR